MKDRQRLREIFIWTTAAVGAAVCAWAAAHLDASALDFPFLLLVACTLGIGSRLGIRIPRVSGAVTVADTFIFLTLLLYGGDAAVLLAAAEGLFTSARVNRRLSTHLCNAGTMAISVFLASRALVFCFGGVTALVRGGYSSRYLGALTLLAFVHYAVNSTITAVGQALKLGESVWRTWRSGYLWSSLTFFAGAFAAGVIARPVGVVGVYAVLGVLPVVAVIYVTYLTYLRNIESSQERADEAQRHVEELSRYIAEQERIREQFSHVEKMSALGVLASGVAHNLNNTLAAILGRAELMLSQTADPKTRRGL
ncbi:MAG: hypothetical protein M3444_07525, partial [Acidobacteriota bacterium]|nr:hypothetical protein [Acidobacteriota bacterium]